MSEPFRPTRRSAAAALLLGALGARRRRRARRLHQQRPRRRRAAAATPPRRGGDNAAPGKQVTIGFSAPAADHGWIAAIANNAKAQAAQYPDVTFEAVEPDQRHHPADRRGRDADQQEGQRRS